MGCWVGHFSGRPGDTPRRAARVNLPSLQPCFPETLSLLRRCTPAFGAASMAYTFKDDGGTMTYYREYNKEVLDKNDTLVGNWVEERALRDQIGTGRYALWVN